MQNQLLSLEEHDPRQATVYPEGQQVWLQLLEDCLHVLPAGQS